MRRIFFALIVLTLTVSAGFSLSCTKKEPADEPLSKPPMAQAPPDHSKIIDKLKKSTEESKKVIVAKVNGADINVNDLIRQMNMIAPRYIQPGQERTPEIDKKIEKDALDMLIFEELAIQEAERQGLKAAPEKVEEVLKRVRTNLGTEDNYKAYLLKTGLNEDELQNKIRKGRLFEMITKEEIYDKVQLDKARIRDIYEKEKSRFIKPDVLTIEDVFFASGKDDEGLMEKAGETLSALMKNKGDLSKLDMTGHFVIRKGIVDNNVYPNIYKASDKMKAGEVSAVIKEDDGLHIVKIVDKEPSRQMTEDEADKLIRQHLMREEAEKRKKEWEKELRQKSKIEVLLDKKKKDEIIPVN